MIQEIIVTPKNIQVVLSGNIYAKEANVIKESLVGYIDRGNPSISIDCSGVEYIDCSGLGTLVYLHKRAMEKGGQVQIHCAQGLVKNLFKLTKLDKMFDMI